MDLVDQILRISGVIGPILGAWFLLKESPFKLRRSKADAEGTSFDLYTKALGALRERDLEIEGLRDKLDAETQRSDSQEDSIRQLRRDANNQDGEIKRIERRAKRSENEAAEYKKNFDTVTLEVRNLNRENKILRAILRKHGLLTPEIEAEIAASLEIPPVATPPDGTPSPDLPKV